MTSDSELNDAFSKPYKPPSEKQAKLKSFLASNAKDAPRNDTTTIEEKDNKQTIEAIADTDPNLAAIEHEDLKEQIKESKIASSKEDSKMAAVLTIEGNEQTIEVVADPDPTLYKNKAAGDGAEQLLQLAQSDVASNVASADCEPIAAIESEEIKLAAIEELKQELLKVGDDEIIDKDGWVEREFDQKYIDLLPDDLKHAKKKEQIAFIKDLFINLNNTCHPRNVYDNSTPPFDLINIPELSSSLRDMIFDGNDNFTFMVKQHFTDVENSDYGIHPTAINFEYSNVLDYRLQIAFKNGSIIHKNVQSKLIEHCLIDPDKEDVEEVSIIIGGSTIQDFHTDIPRIGCYFFVDKKESIIGWELNRGSYNDVMSSGNAATSILIDLSYDKSGLFLTLPPDAVEEQKKDIVTINYERQNIKFECQTKREGKGKAATAKAYTIKFSSDCRFVGDYVHAGADNLQKLKSKVSMTSMLTDASALVNNENNLNKNSDLLKLLTGCPEKLSKVTRLFAKTIPKKLSKYIPRSTVYFPKGIENKFMDERTSTKQKIQDNSMLLSTTKTKNESLKSTPKSTPEINRKLEDDFETQGLSSTTKTPTRMSTRKKTPSKPFATVASLPKEPLASLQEKPSAKKPRGKKVVKKSGELSSSGSEEEMPKRSKRKKTDTSSDSDEPTKKKKTKAIKKSKVLSSDSDHDSEEPTKNKKKKRTKKNPKHLSPDSDSEKSSLTRAGSKHKATAISIKN